MDHLKWFTPAFRLQSTARASGTASRPKEASICLAFKETFCKRKWDGCHYAALYIISKYVYIYIYTHTHIYSHPDISHWPITSVTLHREMAHLKDLFQVYTWYQHLPNGPNMGACLVSPKIKLLHEMLIGCLGLARISSVIACRRIINTHEGPNGPIIPLYAYIPLKSHSIPSLYNE